MLESGRYPGCKIPCRRIDVGQDRNEIIPMEDDLLKKSRYRSFCILCGAYDNSENNNILPIRQNYFMESRW